MNETNLMQLILEFHMDAERQGPGSDEMTFRALETVRGHGQLRNILDIGCGTGAQTMVLARHTEAQITAVDLFPSFLETLKLRAEQRGVHQRVTPMEMSMDKLIFEDGSFDLVWAEGCIYHIGFARGLTEWKRLLMPGGHLVVSEICWLTDTRPREIEDYWMAAYSEIDTIPAKLEVIRKCGYELADTFALPESCWTDHYYTPIRERSAPFLKEHGSTADARFIIDEGLKEADLYDKYKTYYSYVFFIMKPNG